MLTKYIYGGPTGPVGRFGILKKGDVVELTEDEAAKIPQDGTMQWGKYPVNETIPRRIRRASSSPYLVGPSNNGDAIKVLQNAPGFRVDLPSIVGLAIGYQISVQLDEDSTNNSGFQVFPNGSEKINEQASLTVVDSASYLIFNDGAEWKSRIFVP